MRDKRDSNITFRIERATSSAERMIGKELLERPRKSVDEKASPKKDDDNLANHVSPYSSRVLANQFGFLSKRQQKNVASCSRVAANSNSTLSKDTSHVQSPGRHGIKDPNHLKLRMQNYHRGVLTEMKRSSSNLRGSRPSTEFNVNNYSDVIED